MPDIPPSGAHLNRVIAYTEDQIGALHKGDEGFVCQRRQACAPQGQVVVFGKHAFGFVAGDHRHVVAFGKRDHGAFRMLVHRIDAHDHHRARGLGEPIACGGQVSPGRGRSAGRCARGRGEGGNLGICHGDRHVDVHRAPAPFCGDGDRFVGDDMGRISSERKARLGDRAEHGLLVYHLVGVGLRLARVHAACQNNERHLILQRVGHGVYPVQRAGADGPHQDRWRVVAVVHAFGDEASGVFVLGKDETDACLFQGVDEGEHLAPRHAKSSAAACGIEPAGQCVSGADGIGHGAAFRR